MSNQFQQVSQKFNTLELRLRLLLTFAGTLIIALIIDLLWLTPTSNDIKLYQDKIAQTEQQILQIVEAQSTLNKSIAEHKNNPLVIQLKSLKEKTNLAKQKLAEKTMNLVSPNEMTKVLEHIIATTKNLELVALNKQPPTPVFNEPKDSKNAENFIQLYRHTIDITLMGSFSSSQDLLVQLENMPQKVAFDRFNFKVENYPKSAINLSVSTLSFDKKWIGG